MAPRNPFRPSFGITPTVVVGRELVTMNVGLALLEGPGSPYRFTLVSGPRGSGKTVLLNLLEEEARHRGWTVLRVTSSHDMVDDLVATDIPALLRDITGKKTRRIVTGGSVAGIGSVTTQAESAFPVRESLRTLLHSLVTTLDDRDTGLFITVDEIHAARPADLHRLTDAIQNLVRDGLPVAMSVAGLPYEISALLDHPGTTFLRRACPVQLGTLRDAEVADALRKTADDGGRPFTEEALTAATDYCHGYAYLIQLLGSVSWTFSTGGRITTEDVAAALPFTRERKGLQVHAPALREIPERELEFLRSVAVLGTPARTGEIAERMGIAANQASTYRRRLINRGLISPAGHGLVDIEVPYLAAYLRDHAED